jgi:hypothetical protein
MTSANVYYLDLLERVEVEFDPEDRSTWLAPKLLHRERCHALTHNNFNWDKILSLNQDETEVLTWGYDEEDEYWDSTFLTGQSDFELYENDLPNPLPTLREWIEKMKPMNKELREKLKESMT